MSHRKLGLQAQGQEHHSGDTLEEGAENETKSDQIQENPRNGQGRSAAVDTDEDTPRFGRSRYAALEDFQAAQL